MVRGVGQTFFDSIQRLAGTSQDEEKVLLGDGTISRVNEFPPAADRLLYLNLGLFPHNEGVDQPVHLAFDCLIGN